MEQFAQHWNSFTRYIADKTTPLMVIVYAIKLYYKSIKMPTH